MKAKTKINQVLARWAVSVGRHITCHRVIPPRSGELCALPTWVCPQLTRGLERRGICALYTHQRQAAEAARAGKDVVVATPTASGKTLCYNLPVFQALLEEPEARALYLFPTKALARDQVAEARALAASAEADVGVAVYDGDTPPEQRRAARRRARIIATNPDMLHSAILPHHPSWAELFSGLRYVVVDELHTYRGVFGSHLAHVLRRLQRVARLHGARPQFIATSATIANPEELIARLIGRPAELGSSRPSGGHRSSRPSAALRDETAAARWSDQSDQAAELVAESGAPGGERHFVIYNPRLVDVPLSLREGAIKAACRLTCDLVQAGLGTLVFCRSRLAVEVMVRELRDHLGRLEPTSPSTDVRGYRGGYLPGRRREVEHALRRGETAVVVATSALELGIDIGGLDAVVLVGWPGSRAAAWQRAGRAGRRLEPSLAVLVASSEPVDQFVAADPDYFFGQAPEHARINPDNPSILVPHLKCAAAELPFFQGEAYGDSDPRETDEVLACLAEAGLLHRSAGKTHYVGHPHPSSEVHLRGHLDENFLVVQQPGGQVVAEVDYHDAPQVLHDQAIYQLEGRQYQVLRLDHDSRKAYVSEVSVDYYTDAMTHTKVRILEQLEQAAEVASLGEVHVVNRVVGFKKIKLHTQENLGYGDVCQPERQMHTTALWLGLPPERLRGLRCSPAEIAAASLGAAYALHSVSALLLMSDSRDLGRAVGDARSGWFAASGRFGPAAFSTPGDGSELAGWLAPTIFLFDRYPGGIGLADRLFEERRQLVARAAQMVAGCACRAGCPACVGPGAGRRPRALAVEMLRLMEQALAEPLPPRLALGAEGALVGAPA